jgi:hypothetical protein
MRPLTSVATTTIPAARHVNLVGFMISPSFVSLIAFPQMRLTPLRVGMCDH